MAKQLPYFRWYPADAEIDEAYSSMTDEELGFFHRCLNKAWVNGGLPCEIGAIAALLKVSNRYFLKVWPKVSVKWERRGDRLVNPRQERERQLAIEKGEKNKRPGNANATREKRDREFHANETERVKNAIDPQHARARADSGSVSSVFSSEGESAERGNGSALIVIDPAARPSGRFEEWWAMWSRVRGTNHRIQAESFYFASVTVATEADCFECTASYLASLDNPGKGYNPENFLSDQAPDKFKARFVARAPPKAHQQISDAEQAAMIEAFGRSQGR